MPISYHWSEQKTKNYTKEKLEDTHCIDCDLCLFC